MTDLGTVPGDTYSTAVAVNDQGDIIVQGGSSVDLGHSYLYHDGTMTQLGGENVDARDINDNGEIVGGILSSAGSYHPFFYRDGAMIDTSALDATFNPFAIDNNGDMVGWGERDGQLKALLFHNGITTEVGGEAAYDISDQGQIVGEGHFGNAFQAFSVTAELAPTPTTTTTSPSTTTTELPTPSTTLPTSSTITPPPPPPVPPTTTTPVTTTIPAPTPHAAHAAKAVTATPTFTG